MSLLTGGEPLATVAIVLAGGSGARMGSATPKQLLRVGGRTLVERCVDVFESSDAVDEIVVVTAPSVRGEIEGLVSAAYSKVRAILDGGPTRTASTRAALDHVSSIHDECHVLIHDAARPLLTAQIVLACINALQQADAVATAVPATDTMLEVEAGTVVAIPGRERMWRAQTPQGFRLSTVRRAHELAAADGGVAATDDCGLVRRYLPDVDVRVAAGDERNLKITTAADLLVAEALLADGGDS